MKFINEVLLMELLFKNKKLRKKVHIKSKNILKFE